MCNCNLPPPIGASGCSKGRTGKLLREQVVLADLRVIRSLWQRIGIVGILGDKLVPKAAKI